MIVISYTLHTNFGMKLIQTSGINGLLSDLHTIRYAFHTSVFTVCTRTRGNIRFVNLIYAASFLMMLLHLFILLLQVCSILVQAIG